MRELELGPIDIDDHTVPFWLRFLGSIDRLERGQSPRWPRDTRPEYLTATEGAAYSVSEVLSDDMAERVHDWLSVRDGAEEMVIPPTGIEPVTPVSAGWPTGEERAAEERERAAKIRAMLEGRR